MSIMSIRVYIISDIGKERSNYIAKRFFSDKKFEVVFHEESGSDTKRVLSILSSSKTDASKKQVLIIKDSSIAKSPGYLIKTLNLVNENDYDLFYLSREDQPFQAILFSTKGRDKVIDILKEEDINANLNGMLQDIISQTRIKAMRSNPVTVE